MSLAVYNNISIAVRGGEGKVCYSKKCTHCGGNLFAAALFAGVGISKANAASEEYARYTVVLDAGHGGVDPGVLGVTTKTKESDINLAIVKKLAGYFSDAGFRVILTRKNEGGLYGLLGTDLRYRRSRHEYLAYTQEKLNKVNAEFDKIADECYQRARQIVQANAELIKKLMPVLVDRGNLFKKEYENVLTELGGIKAVK